MGKKQSAYPIVSGIVGRGVRGEMRAFALWMVACSVFGQAALVIGVEDATLDHWDADAWLSGATQHPADVSLAPEWMSATGDLGESISTGCEDQPSWAADCPNLAEHCGRSLAMKIKCRKTCGCGPKVHDPIPQVGGNNTNSTGPKNNNAQIETKVVRSQKQLDITLEMDAESLMQVEETVTARTHAAARNGTRDYDPTCVDEPSWAADCNHLSTHCAESMVMKIKCRKTCGCGEYIPDPIQAKNEDSLEPPSLSPEDAKKAAKAAAEATKKAESLNIKPVIAGETQVQRATKAAASLSAEEASKKAAQDQRRAATKKEEKARAEVDKAKIDKEANDLEKMEKDISKQTAVTVVKPKPKENVGKKAAADAKADEQKAAKEKADNDAKAEEQKAKNDQQKDAQTKDAASKAKKIQKEIKDTEANAAKDETKELKKEDAKEAATKEATKKPVSKEEAKPASKETAKTAAKEDAKKPTAKETEKKSSAQMRAEADADLAESNAELKAEGDDDEDDDELFLDDDALLEVSEGHVPPNEKEKRQWEEARKAAQVLVAKVVAAGKKYGAREAKAAAQLEKGAVRSTRASTHNHPEPGN